MKKTVLAASLTAMLALTCASAFAEDASKFSGQIGYSKVDVDGIDFGTVSIGGAYKLSETTAIEGNFGIGVTEKDYSGVALKMDYLASAYLVGYLPANDEVDFLLRAGVAQTKFTGSYAGYSSSANSDTVFSYGAGVRYFPKAGNNGVRFDVTRHGADTTELSLSYVRKF